MVGTLRGGGWLLFRPDTDSVAASSTVPHVDNLKCVKCLSQIREPMPYDQIPDAVTTVGGTALCRDHGVSAYENIQNALRS